MGADLLLAVLAHPKDKKLNWAAGRKVARTLDREKLMRGLEGVYGEAPETVKEGRSTLNSLITDLKNELDASTRDSYELTVGRYHLSIRGGTSWGDDPSEGYTIVNSLGYFPEVLKAIGFSLNAVRWA